MCWKSLDDYFGVEITFEVKSVFVILLIQQLILQTLIVVLKVYSQPNSNNCLIIRACLAKVVVSCCYSCYLSYQMLTVRF